MKEVVISNNKKLSEDEKRKVYYKISSDDIREFLILKKENITKEIGKKYFFKEMNKVVISFYFKEIVERYKEYCENCEIKKECRFGNEDYCIANWMNFRKLEKYEFFFDKTNKVSEKFLEKYKEELDEVEEEKYFILVEKIQDVLI